MDTLTCHKLSTYQVVIVASIRKLEDGVLVAIHVRILGHTFEHYGYVHWHVHPALTISTITHVIHMSIAAL